ncbi:hypothetical protein [Marichromatium purpuratum]|nr:hypothetical protein [Marichromatium purpuratum]
MWTKAIETARQQHDIGAALERLESALAKSLWDFAITTIDGIQRAEIGHLVIVATVAEDAIPCARAETASPYQVVWPALMRDLLIVPLLIWCWRSGRALCRTRLVLDRRPIPGVRAPSCHRVDP